jgi:hypothetical protein
MPTTAETLNFDSFLTTTIKNYDPTKNKNFLTYRPAVSKLFDEYRHTDSGGGRTWQGIAEYGSSNSVQWFNGAEAFPQDPNQVAQPIRQDWRYLGGSVSMTDIERLENSRAAALADLLQMRVDQLLRTFNIMLGNEIFSDGTHYNGKSITGLANAVQAANPPSNTCMGLSATTWPFWRNNYQSVSSWAANGISGTSTDAILTLYNNCTDGMAKKPTYALTDQQTWERYNATLQKAQRYVTDDGSSNAVDAGPKFMSLQYQGIPIYWDRQTPIPTSAGGTLYFLNNDDIHFMVDPKAMFKWTEPRTPVAQLTYTRICYLRTFLCVRSRMFLGVASIAAA